MSWTAAVVTPARDLVVGQASGAQSGFSSHASYVRGAREYVGADWRALTMG